MQWRQINNHSGFTLIESIAVLVILGILGLLAIASFTGRNTDLFMIEATLKNHIRYAQSKCMFTDTGVWGVCLSAGSEAYWLTQENSGAVRWGSVTKPWGGEASEIMDAQGRMVTSVLNVTIDGVSAGNNLILLFDNLGVPFYRAGTGDVNIDGPLMDNGSLTRPTADIRIALSDDSGNSRTITITHETGFVP